MIFMSQSGLTNPAREGDWDRWYIEHLTVMATVPGISSAQRFKTSNAAHPPSLAVYSIASANVFQDPYYLSVRGMGDWLPLIDKKYYRRNLFDGSERAPDVTGTELLLISDRDRPEPDFAGFEWIWLRCIAIDKSTPYRGIAIVSAGMATRANDARIAVYHPVTARYTAR